MTNEEGRYLPSVLEEEDKEHDEHAQPKAQL